MRRRHLRAVAAIEQENQPHPWSAELFRRELAWATSATTSWPGRPASGRVRRVALRRRRGPRDQLAVADESAATGCHPLMVALVDAALDRGATALTLEVRAGNTAAQGLYRRFGLAPAGVRQAYYQPNDEDALIMWAHDIDARPTGSVWLDPRHLDWPSSTVTTVEALVSEPR